MIAYRIGAAAWLAILAGCAPDPEPSAPVSRAADVWTIDVVDAGGEAVAGAVVTWIDYQTFDFRWLLEVPLRLRWNEHMEELAIHFGFVGKTDADGRFTIPRVPRPHPSAPVRASFNVRTPNAHGKVRLHETKTSAIVVVRPERLVRLVLRDEDNRRYPDVPIYYSERRGTEECACTGPDGTALLHVDPSTTVLRCTPWIQGSAWSIRTFEIPANKPGTLECVVPPVGYLDVRVVDHDGDPLALGGPVVPDLHGGGQHLFHLGVRAVNPPRAGLLRAKWLGPSIFGPDENLHLHAQPPLVGRLSVPVVARRDYEVGLQGEWPWLWETYVSGPTAGGRRVDVVLSPPEDSVLLRARVIDQDGRPFRGSVRLVLSTPGREREHSIGLDVFNGRIDCPLDASWVGAVPTLTACEAYDNGILRNQEGPPTRTFRISTPLEPGVNRIGTLEAMRSPYAGGWIPEESR